MSDIQAVLNTEVYLYGVPFDRDGEVTYMLTPWSKHFKLNHVTFTRSKGDATKIRVEFWDRYHYLPDAILLGMMEIPSTHMKALPDAMPWKVYKDHDRLYMRLIALDGEELNHAHVLLRGETIED